MRGVCFDMDGTLALTDHLHHAAYRAVLPALGYDPETLDGAWFAATVQGRVGGVVRWSTIQFL